MDLGTFGAIMKFALEIENSAREFYKKAEKEVTDEPLAELFGSLASRTEKRIKTLERVRRENITEMILEPIQGLDSNSFEITGEVPQDSNSIKKKAVSIEKTLFEFYNVAAAKIDFLSEASYAFELLAEMNEDTIRTMN